MKLIQVSNLAGGVGKTTTAHAIAVAATEYGQKVLLIDADPSASLTFVNGVENPRVSTKEFLAGEYSSEAALLKTSERFSLLAASSRLASLDFEKVITSDTFKAAVKDFDLVIVDCPSGPDRLSTYFNQIADLLLIPATTEILSIRGALHAKEFANTAGFSAKPKLLITKNNGELPAELVEIFGAEFEVLEPVIRIDEQVPNSQTTGKSILTIANQSGVASDYREIAYSLLEYLELV